MEGSSHAKGLRSKIRSKRKHGFYQKSAVVELYFARHFSSDKQQVSRFTKLFQDRTVLSPHYLATEEWHDLNFDFQEVLFRNGLKFFVELQTDYFPELVKVFYSNLSVHNNVLRSSVSGKEITFTPQLWYALVGLSCNGSTFNCSQLHKFERYDRMAALRSLLVDPTRIPPTSHKFTARKLKLKERMLQFSIGKILDPRKGNFARVHEHEIFLIWAMLSDDVAINWPHFFSDRMLKVADDDKVPLPYACLISLFIRHFDAFSEDDKVVRMVPANKVGNTSISRMKLVKRDGVWMYNDDPPEVPEVPYETDDEDEPVDAAPQPTSASQSSGGTPADPSHVESIPPPWFICEMALLESRMLDRMRDMVREELRSYFGSRMLGSHQFPPPGPSMS